MIWAHILIYLYYIAKSIEHTHKLNMRWVLIIHFSKPLILSNNFDHFTFILLKKLKLGIRQAKEQISPYDRERIRAIERELDINNSDDSASEEEE